MTDVTVILDAADELEDIGPARAASWLPDTLPPNAHVIVSTRPGQTLDELRSRLSSLQELQLNTLTKGDADEIVHRFLTRYGKRMSTADVNALTAKASAGTPLYIEVALEELRTLGTYETVSESIGQLPDDVSALFDWVFERLEDEDGFRDADGRRIGRTLVKAVASLLAASVNGLSELDLVELLTPPDPAGVQAAGDPQGNVAALVHLLRPYLLFRNELVDFSHQQIRAAVEKRYLPTEASASPRTGRWPPTSPPSRTGSHRESANWHRSSGEQTPAECSANGRLAGAPARCRRRPTAHRGADRSGLRRGEVRRGPAQTCSSTMQMRSTRCPH